MNEAINFTVGFSHGIEWPWPIAVYLLLAGISGGALLVALLIRYYKKQTENTPVYKAATLVAFITIAVGMVFLVADLHKPLYFWKILINFNLSSVMSLGVIAISFYIPLTFVLVLFAFEDKLKFITPILDMIRKFRAIIESTTFVFALIIGAYTGFLISVLVRFPLVNTSILPALFVVSGLSAGTAATLIVARSVFKEDLHSPDMTILHKLEWPIMSAEILFIFMLFVSLLVGNEGAQYASAGFTSSVWAILFWLGVIGVGFIVPILLNFVFNKKFTELQVLYMSGAASILGVLFLRLFILYAGQAYGINAIMK